MPSSFDLWRADPLSFIETALIDPESGEPFVLSDAERWFLKFAFQINDSGRLKYPELVFGAIKKSGKTTLAAIIVITMTGEGGTTNLLVLSQVILSLQLSFAVFPLVMFTSSKLKMGEFVNGRTVQALAWFIAIIIALLNAWLLVQTFRGWLS